MPYPGELEKREKENTGKRREVRNEQEEKGDQKRKRAKCKQSSFSAFVDVCGDKDVGDEGLERLFGAFNHTVGMIRRDTSGVPEKRKKKKKECQRSSTKTLFFFFF